MIGLLRLALLLALGLAVLVVVHPHLALTGVVLVPWLLLAALAVLVARRAVGGGR